MNLHAKYLRQTSFHLKVYSRPTDRQTHNRAIALRVPRSGLDCKTVGLYMVKFFSSLLLLPAGL